MSFARTNPSPRSTRPAGASPRWRWIAVGLLSLLLHLTAVNWATGNLRLPGSANDQAPVVMQTSLIQPPAAEPPPRPRAIPVAARAAKPRPKPPAPRQSAAAKTASAKAPPATASPPAAMEAPPILAAAASDSSMASIASSPSGNTAAGSGSGSSSAFPDLASLEPVETMPSTAAEETSLYKIDPPPSATLEYQVQALREGQMVHGHGKIAWTLNGSQYAINGEAGILFISLLDFGSRGQIDEFGIAPTQYTEKRFRRAQTETRFNRDSKLITFSASPKSFPLKGGEQDRASIIWQLAAIGRGDAARYAPGVQIPLFIAGVRDGDTWNIQVIGEENIDVGMGNMRAWHVRRAPRAGDKDQILDIWLTPSHHWYPAKLRYTEVNGEYLELSLSNIAAPAS